MPLPVPWLCTPVSIGAVVYTLPPLPVARRMCHRVTPPVLTGR